MKILIACEYSGIVRDAFIKKGHEAISCDLLPTERPGPHYQGYLEDFIGDGSEWDMIIAFPPCTFLSSSGLHRNIGNPWRQKKTEEALDFVRMILSRNCLKIALENPVGCISTRICPESQYIQPYDFGHNASKTTGLWLKGLPLLKPTKYVPGRIVIMPSGKRVMRWKNQTDSGQNKLSGGEKGSKIRSLTYQGIADAMAEQWCGPRRGFIY